MKKKSGYEALNEEISNYDIESEVMIDDDAPPMTPEQQALTDIYNLVVRMNKGMESLQREIVNTRTILATIEQTMARRPKFD